LHEVKRSLSDSSMRNMAAECAREAATLRKPIARVHPPFERLRTPSENMVSEVEPVREARGSFGDLATAVRSRVESWQRARRQGRRCFHGRPTKSPTWENVPIRSSKTVIARLHACDRSTEGRGLASALISEELNCVGTTQRRPRSHARAPHAQHSGARSRGKHHRS
jgi:hypothetical protein